MDLKRPKFIIYKGEIRLGLVIFHKDLLPESYDKSLVAGGGTFVIDKENESITFSGKSYDFGKFDEELVLTAPIYHPRLGKYERIVE